MSPGEPARTAESRQSPPPLPPGYDSCLVELGGDKRFELVFDAGTDDMVVQVYRIGHHGNEYLTRPIERFLTPGSYVLDLGAHVGTFSLKAAADGCLVAAVEASPKHVDLLQRSVERSGFGRSVEVVHAAVGDQPGSVRFRMASLWGMVDLGATLTAEAEHAPVVEVPMRTGDEILGALGWSRVDFMKVDVEGSEVAAFRGLSGLLERDDAPAIVYECNGLSLPHFGYRTSNLMRLLEWYGYRSYRMEADRFLPVAPADLQPEAWVDLIALKPRHEEAVRGEIGPPVSPGELIARAVEESRKPHPNHRRYIAEALGRAADAVVLDPRVQEVLDALSSDCDERVRLATAWRATRRYRAA
jgi:FkbM family methyltransferase